MNFFFDICFPRRLCAAVAAIDGNQHHFDHHADHFAQDTIDTVWLNAIGSWKDRPIVIRGDTRILSRREEQRELMQQDLMFVCLYPGFTSHQIYESAWKFFRAWPFICEAVSSARQPSVFKVAPSATRVDLFSTTQGLVKK
jgi:hypothetical protein